jgi:hypothetical protein
VRPQRAQCLWSTPPGGEGGGERGVASEGLEDVGEGSIDRTGGVGVSMEHAAGPGSIGGDCSCCRWRRASNRRSYSLKGGAGHGIAPPGARSRPPSPPRSTTWDIRGVRGTAATAPARGSDSQAKVLHIARPSALTRHAPEILILPRGGLRGRGGGLLGCHWRQVMLYLVGLTWSWEWCSASKALIAAWWICTRSQSEACGHWLAQAQEGGAALQEGDKQYNRSGRGGFGLFAGRGAFGTQA